MSRDEERRDVFAVPKRPCSCGEDFAPPTGYQNRVLELSAQASVGRANRPFVVRIDFDFPASEIDHGLDREGHAGSQPIARASFAVMANLRLLVKFASDSVADEISHDAAALSLDVLLNRRADIAKPSAVSRLLDSELQGSPRHFDDVSRLLAWGPHIKRGARVTVKAFKHVSHVDVHDVAVAEHGPIGDAMTHDFVDARAHAFRKAFVMQRGRTGPLAKGIFVDDAVDFVRRHPAANFVPDQQQRLGRKAADGAHQLDFFRALDIDGHGFLF